MPTDRPVVSESLKMTQTKHFIDGHQSVLFYFSHLEFLYLSKKNKKKQFSSSILSETSLWNCLNFKELLARDKHD